MLLKPRLFVGRDEFLCLTAFLFLLVPCGTGLLACVVFPRESRRYSKEQHSPGGLCHAETTLKIGCGLPRCATRILGNFSFTSMAFTGNSKGRYFVPSRVPHTKLAASSVLPVPFQRATCG